MFPDGYQLPDTQHVQRVVEETAIKIYVGIADYLFVVDGDWVCVYGTLFERDMVYMPGRIGGDDISDRAN